MYNCGGSTESVKCIQQSDATQQTHTFSKGFCKETKVISIEIGR